jgi:hypothetical protein
VAAEAESPAAESPPAESPAPAFRFRTIGELAERCGHYCWLEDTLFALLGDRACGEGAPDGRVVAPEVRVVLSEMSARHAFVAAQWRDRLPVRAGIDPAAFVVPPPGPTAAAVDLLAAELDPQLVLAGVVEQLLPRLAAAYAAHLAQASPVSEAPVRAVLGCAIRAAESEVREARSLLGAMAAQAGDGASEMTEFTSRVERALETGDCISPAARAS